MTTDTPRTDDFVSQNSLLEFVEDKHELTIFHARQLERELDGKIIDLKVSDGAVNALTWKLKRAEAERDAYKKLALELCAELCQICKDPIHRTQLEELSK